jgi:hypothetical protein
MDVILRRVECVATRGELREEPGLHWRIDEDDGPGRAPMPGDRGMRQGETSEELGIQQWAERMIELRLTEYDGAKHRYDDCLGVITSWSWTATPNPWTAGATASSAGVGKRSGGGLVLPGSPRPSGRRRWPARPAVLQRSPRRGRGNVPALRLPSAAGTPLPQRATVEGLRLSHYQRAQGLGAGADEGPGGCVGQGGRL